MQCISNFDEIGLSQLTAEIKVLPVSENGRPPYWNSTSGFDSDMISSSACHPDHSVSAYQISSKSYPWWSYDITIFSRWRPVAILNLI